MTLHPTETMSQIEYAAQQANVINMQSVLQQIKIHCVY